MFRKRGPLLLFFFLVLILIFVIGVRYGQDVERMNKVIDYVMKLTPTTKPQAPLDYKSHTVPSCAISFLYPSDLKIDSTSSASAVFVKDNEAFIHVNCAPQNKLVDLFEKTTATASVTFQNKEIVVKKGDGTYLFNFRNTRNGRTVYVLIQEKLYSLFEGSLKF